MTVQPADHGSSTNAAPVSQGRGPLRRRALAAAAMVLLTIVLLEGLFRVYVSARGWTPNCYAAQLELMRPHPINGYDLESGFELRSGVYQISTNSIGLRGPEITNEKPPGVVRVAVLGGSSVFGYLVNDGEEAARLLEHELNSAGCRVEVINAGVPGYNLFHSLVRYREVVAPLDPDVVVLYAGYNDLGYLCSDDPEAPRWRRLNVAPAWERWLGQSVVYGFLVYRLAGRSAGEPIAARIGTDPTPAGVRQFEQNLAGIAEAISESGARFVICGQASAARGDADPSLTIHLGDTQAEATRARDMFARMRESLQKVAQDRNAVFLDAGDEIPPTREYLGDAIHLTRAGEEQLADMLSDALKPLIPNCAGTADASEEQH